MKSSENGFRGTSRASRAIHETPVVARAGSRRLPLPLLVAESEPWTSNRCRAKIDDLVPFLVSSRLGLVAVGPIFLNIKLNMPKPFFDRLAQEVRAKQTPLVVGLDPRWASLPSVLQRGEDSLEQRAGAYRDFCLGVLDVVAPLVPAVKPQVAFFEQLGWQGMKALADVVAHARQLGVLVVMDGKRNDIGSTAEGYADGWLGQSSPWQGDALTISPYLGDDSLEPFVRVASERSAGLFVLVKTSNPGGKFLQDLTTEQTAIYRHVGQLVEDMAARSAGDCGYGVTGAVVGATYPEQLAELRSEMPHTWFLVPGYGSQGGTAADVAPAFDSCGLGAIVNSSRAIIFAHARDEFAGRDWQQAVEAATRQAIDDLASVVTIGAA